MSTHADDRSEVIFVAYITTKDGRRIYASQYGLRAFPIRVKRITSRSSS